MSCPARARSRTCPIIYTGVNAADTIENAGNKNHTNGTPLTILIPNLDRHFVHIKQYQDTNRTPRPGHASYASFVKYGPDDDAIGAGFFSGRYTSTIVAAGSVAKKVLKQVRHRGVRLRQGDRRRPLPGRAARGRPCAPRTTTRRCGTTSTRSTRSSTSRAGSTWTCGSWRRPPCSPRSRRRSTRSATRHPA